ncbi:unannotated protein [freshwater metagenome]|uniref:Unannotated protein n=1 Tax=freshwater metagenome TaxID=449393 RepID=A0A6J6WTW5_9ZZZZ
MALTGRYASNDHCGFTRQDEANEYCGLRKGEQADDDVDQNCMVAYLVNERGED